MAKDKDVGSKKGKEEHSYWRVTITYIDNEISGRVYNAVIRKHWRVCVERSPGRSNLALHSLMYTDDCSAKDDSFLHDASCDLGAAKVFFGPYRLGRAPSMVPLFRAGY